MSQKPNGWLVGYLLVSVLLVGAAGFYFFNSLSVYQEQVDGFQSNTGSIETLLKKETQPNEKNLDSLKTAVKGYEGNVKALFDALQKYQKPLDLSIQDSQFPQLLLEVVKSFQGYAKEKGMVIDKPESFFMGMGSYQTTIPNPKMVPLLDFQLKASDRLLRNLVDAGVARLIFFARDPLVGEFGEVDEKIKTAFDDQIVKKFPVTMQFEGTHQALQSFLNTISSDPDYFFIVRATRIENGAPNGPPPNVMGVRYRGPDGKEITQEDSDAILKDLQPEAITAKVAELNWTVVSEDARILFGNEIIKVFAVIDVARFEKPASEKKEEKAAR